jgi:hypothetical protein
MNAYRSDLLRTSKLSNEVSAEALNSSRVFLEGTLRCLNYRKTFLPLLPPEFLRETLVQLKPKDQSLKTKDQRLKTKATLAMAPTDLTGVLLNR